MKIKTKTEAIKHARNRVSDLFLVGGQYKYRIYDEKLGAWNETHSGLYFEAQSRRSFSLICDALEYLHGETYEMPAYYGGKWTSYIK